jgi:hypothetical protein
MDRVAQTLGFSPFYELGMRFRHRKVA